MCVSKQSNKFIVDTGNKRAVLYSRTNIHFQPKGTLLLSLPFRPFDQDCTQFMLLICQARYQAYRLLLASVFVCYKCFLCIKSFEGNYTEALNDAKIAVSLQPSFLKAFGRGKSTVDPLHIFLSLHDNCSMRRSYSLKHLYPQLPSIQLFRERLSDKVHAKTPKGIVGGFECTVFQRNLKE